MCVAVRQVQNALDSNRLGFVGQTLHCNNALPLALALPAYVAPCKYGMQGSFKGSGSSRGSCDTAVKAVKHLDRFTMCLLSPSRGLRYGLKKNSCDTRSH